MPEFEVLDGVAHYTNASHEWDVANLAVVNATDGLGGGPCLRLDDPRSYVQKNVGVHTGLRYWGFGFKTADFDAVNDRLWSVWDGGTLQACLILKSDGRLEARRGVTTAIGISTAVVPGNVRNSLVVGIEIHNTAGVFKMWHNGTLIVDLTSVDTQGSGVAQLTRFELGPHGVSGDSIARAYDMIWMSTLNQGDQKIITRFPNADGASGVQFTKAGSSPAATNWQGVDEVAPNDGVDFNEGATVGFKDHLATPTCGLGAAVQKTLCIKARISNSDAGPRTLRTGVKLAGTTVMGPSLSPPATPTWLTTTSFFDAKPGGGAWTGTDADNAEKLYEIET